MGVTVPGGVEGVGNPPADLPEAAELVLATTDPRLAAFVPTTPLAFPTEPRAPVLIEPRAPLGGAGVASRLSISMSSDTAGLAVAVTLAPGARFAPAHMPPPLPVVVDVAENRPVPAAMPMGVRGIGATNCGVEEEEEEVACS